MRRLLVFAALFLGVFLMVQFFPAPRENPPVTAPIQAPAEVAAVLRGACYDCHSNETRWPWYAHVAPVSWVTSRHVLEGRRHLNFSEAGRLSGPERAKLLDEISEEVAEGEMPMRLYRVAHPDARLSDAQRQLIVDWAKAEGARPSTARHRD